MSAIKSFSRAIKGEMTELPDRQGFLGFDVPSYQPLGKEIAADGFINEKGVYEEFTSSDTTEDRERKLVEAYFKRTG